MLTSTFRYDTVEVEKAFIEYSKLMHRGFYLRGLYFEGFSVSKYQCGKFASHGGDIGNAILMLSIYLLLNFRNLRHTISKLSGNHPHGGNRKLTPLPPSDVLVHLLLSQAIFSPLPLRTEEISSVGGVWIFSGTTQYGGLLGLYMGEGYIQRFTALSLNRADFTN